MSMRALLEGDKFNLEKVRCVVVDDNPMSLDILASVCTGFGLRNFAKCESADEAKMTLNKGDWDMVLTDAQMPEMTGYDLVNWIRREAPEANRFIPVVIVTGHTRFSHVVQARDCGAHFIVAKPVTPRVLLERIAWVARDERSFIECDSYCGPDRRFKREGPPAGMEGRRADDLAGEIGAANTPNMSQDEINMMMKPAKVVF